MLEIHWNSQNGWGIPKILPVHDFEIHPFNTWLNYGLQGFESMKAYRDPKGKIRTFRPDKYAARFNSTSENLCLPTFDPIEFVKCLDELLRVEERWVPKAPSTLYIRPIIFSTTNQLSFKPPQDAILFIALSPVGSYYKAEGKPIVLKTERIGAHTWPNGAGNFRPGAVSTFGLKYRKAAIDGGYEDILWINDKKISETNSSNIFIHKIDDNNFPLWITPTLDGSVLPGVYRETIMEFIKNKGIRMLEQDIEIMELSSLCKNDKVKLH